MSAGPGDDVINGFAGNDIIDAGKGEDALFGELGEDILISRDGYDYLAGGPDCDLYRIYPTHTHWHYFEEGCT